MCDYCLFLVPYYSYSLYSYPASSLLFRIGVVVSTVSVFVPVFVFASAANLAKKKIN